MKVNVFLLLFLFPVFGFSSQTNLPVPKERHLGIFYFSEMFGHIYQFASIDSSALTTIACGHPIRVYPAKKQDESKNRSGWSRVKVVGIEGYIQSSYLRPKQVTCFQGQYNKFFNALNLSVTEMYYLGRLPSLYIRGRSKVKK